MSKTLSQTKKKNGSGGVAMNVLRLASNVANGEQIVIGRDTYEIDIINTDSNINTSAAMNATDTETVLTMAAHGRVVGNLIKVESEIMRVKKVEDANTIIVWRGDSGTTKATHVTDSDILQSDAAPAAPVIAIGLVTTLTPTAAAPAIVAVINSRGSHKLIADAISVNEICIRTGAGKLAELLPTTETLAGSNNAWAAAAMYGTVSNEVRGLAMVTRAANATEVAVDHMLFNFPFTVGSAFVSVRGSTGIPNLVWNGAWTVSGGRVTVTNGGASDWAAGDLITVIASE